MKKLLKAFVFSYISIYVSQMVIGGLVFGGNAGLTLFIVVLALALLNFFKMPILSLLSMSTKGFGLLFFRFVLNLVVLYVLTIFIPAFYVVPTQTPELIFFGIMLPSKGLSKPLTLVVSTILFVVTYTFFMWLSVGKNKK